MKIHAGDVVLIITGKDKGKQGTVTKVLSDKNRLIVEGVNMRVRHIKKSAEKAGQRLTYEASLAASNVMLLDPKTKKPTRVGYKMDVKGHKVRFAKVSGEVLPAQSTTKSAMKTKKKMKATEGTEATDVSKTAAGAPPKKQPFWKRAFTGGPDATEDTSKTGKEETIHGTLTPVRRSRESNG
ncbi:50S ribosomal protein L24 [Candidatus Peregrinibacteria bacterium]|nr:50S ribosomal protein L24 [Candidatus Peregrinibacteria bacterium]